MALRDVVQVVREACTAPKTPTVDVHAQSSPAPAAALLTTARPGRYPELPTEAVAEATDIVPHYHQNLCCAALSIVVYGASGDLAKKKTFPALFNLYCRGLVPRHANIIGFARSSYTSDEFRERVAEAIKININDAKLGLVSKFLSHIYYISGPYVMLCLLFVFAFLFIYLFMYNISYDDAAAYIKLNDKLCSLEAASNKQIPGNRMFYFAIPPSTYEIVANTMVPHVTSAGGFVRCVLEKPFGKDLESSRKLAHNLHAVLDESHLYRIDHYLGKEMVQNLLVVRFGNRVFSPIWNREHIENVIISFKEPFGIDGRAGYFDDVGIIRDIMQNHLLQILCLVAMDRPVSMSSEHVRDEKVQILKHILPLRKQDLVIGQYVSDDAKIHKSYRQERDINPEYVDQ
jgi:glucose-6-phosphate 1-dehydrogenase